MFDRRVPNLYEVDGRFECSDGGPRRTPGSTRLFADSRRARNGIGRKRRRQVYKDVGLTQWETLEEFGCAAGLWRARRAARQIEKKMSRVGLAVNVISSQCLRRQFWSFRHDQIEIQRKHQ